MQRHSIRAIDGGMQRCYVCNAPLYWLGVFHVDHDQMPELRQGSETEVRSGVRSKNGVSAVSQAIYRQAVHEKKSRPVVEEPEDEYEDYDDGPDYGSYDDDAYDDYGDDQYGADQYEDYEPAPRRSKSSRSSSKKSKKKKKASGLPPWLKYVALGLAGVVVLGGLATVLVMAVGSLGGGGSNPIDLAWLPEDAHFFARVEPDELWNAPMLAAVRDNETVRNMMEQAASQQGAVNLGLADIDSVTMAGLDIADTYQQRIGILGNRIGSPEVAKKADAKMIGVLRLKKDITVADLGSDAEGRKQDYNGNTYYTSPNNQAVYLADPRTVIVGHEEQVKLAIDRGPVEPRVNRIDFMNAQHQLVVVVAPPKLLKTDSQTPPTATGTSSQQKLQQSLTQKTKAFCFGLSLNSNIDMDVQFQCFTASEAETMKADVDAMLAEMKTKFETSISQAPPQFADFATIGQEAIASLNSSNSGDEVTVSLMVPGRITTAVQEAIASNPLASMMLQGMTQQFNQGATPPAAFGGVDGSPGSLNPSAGMDPAQAGQPAITNPEDFEAGVRQDQQNTLDTLNGIRGRIKSTTGTIQDSVPGGK